MIAFDASQNPLSMTGSSVLSQLATSTAMVTIRILDKNDHAPLFQEADDLGIMENKDSDALIGQVFATDRDIEQNGQIVYKLLSDNAQTLFHSSKDIIGFDITPNGTLYATKSFDRETQVNLLCPF